jgi:nitroreductase
MLKTNRKTDYPILEVILNRWSSRAFSDEAVSETELMTLFDAARWAQNSYNNQPWRFIYSRNGSESWPKFYGLLVPANQIWVQYARVLVLVVSKNSFDYDGSPSVTHTFDTGAACQHMALQAASMDIICHGMQGFDYERARTEFNVPEEYTIEAMFAIGKPGDAKRLPEKLAEREKQTSDRKPLNELVFKDAGKF